MISSSFSLSICDHSYGPKELLTVMCWVLGCEQLQKIHILLIIADRFYHRMIALFCNFSFVHTLYLFLTGMCVDTNFFVEVLLRLSNHMRSILLWIVVACYSEGFSEQCWQEVRKKIFFGIIFRVLLVTWHRKNGRIQIQVIYPFNILRSK